MIRIVNTNTVLQNAFKVGYEKRLNEVWTAQFSLPADDPKNAQCIPFAFVEIFEGDSERVDLFRILPQTTVQYQDQFEKTYVCEHVLSTLLDDIMFQYNETTLLSPTATLNYILGFQSTPLWQLGAVEFTDTYSYKWENENLLSALFSVPKAYNQEYMFTWDTTTTPWTLNLVQMPTDVQYETEVAYEKNMDGLEDVSDPSYIATRVYPLGYGEGVNQLTIAEVNGGIKYLDADTVSLYGVKSYLFVDKTEEDAATLKAKAQAWLETNKAPRVTYTVRNAADIYSITQETRDNIRTPGTLIRAKNSALGVNIQTRIVRVMKPDIDERPGDIELDLSNKILDLADVTTRLQQRQTINDVYAQGATNIDSNDYQDNCDATHPAVIKFYVPEECVRVNKCNLTYETVKFRSYEKATLAGGSSLITSNNSDYDYDLVSMGANWSNSLEPDIQGTTDPQSSHVHSVDTTSGQTGSAGAHDHDVILFTHYHDLNAGGLQHTHKINLPPHTHDQDYGIYEYSDLPTSLTIMVDGNTVSTSSALSNMNLDIIPYLSKDTSGKVNRGIFHTVEITPNTTGLNPNGLARINASVVKQIFVQSRGGGDY